MPVTPQLVRFGVFELDLNTGELCKNGRKLKLQEQPFRLLCLLLEQPGQPVTRDRLKRGALAVGHLRRFRSQPERGDC